MSENPKTIDISDPLVLAQQPLVSVCMLAFQHERFISRAIDGVVAQVCDFPIELIIGEDCSLDKTRAIALDYQARYPQRIRVLYGDANVGGKSNLVRCLAAARAPYIAFCEGDDCWFDRTKLARQVDVFQRYPTCSLVFHAAEIVDAETGRKTGRIRWPFRSRKFSIGDLILGDGGLIPTASIVIKESVLRDRPAWARAAPVSDYPMALYAALAGDVIYIDRIMSAYRSNVPHSWTQRHSPTLAHRLNYATQIDTMLSGLQEDLSESDRDAVRVTISKYYSDVVVRIDGPQAERAEIYLHTKGKLQGSDRLLAWMAYKFGIRLPWVKDVIRKSKTLLRLIKAQFQSGLAS